MRLVWLLLKVQFRSRFNAKDLTSVRAGGKSGARKRAAVLALFAVLAVYLVGIYTFLLNLLLSTAIDFGYPELVMDLVVLITMATTALFGIFITMSGIFLSRDTEMLSALPIPAGHVFLAKFLFVYISEMLISALFLLPAIVLYAIRVEGALGIGIFLRGLYVLLLSPMIPLVVSTILVSLLMLIIGKLRRRDLFITIGTFVLLLGVTLGQFWLQSRLTATTAAGSDFLTEFFNANWSTINSIVKPPFSWASFAIHAGGLSSALNLILFTLVSLLAFAVVRPVCGLIYRYAVSVNAEAPKKTRKGTALTADVRSPRGTVLRKEYRVFFRTPIYLTNGLAGIIFPVLILLAPLLEGGTAGLREFGAQLPDAISALILGGVSVLCSGFNAGAATVLSREGRSCAYLHALPIDPKELSAAKLLFGISLCPIWTAPLCIFAVPVFGIGVWAAVGGFVLGTVGGALVSALCVWIDLARPKLHWDTETEAIKQNFNVALSMLIGLAFTVLSGAGVYWLLAHTGIPAWAVFAACTALLASGLILVSHAAVKAGERTYCRLD